VLNPIWLWLILLSVFIGGFTGHLEAVTKGALASAQDAVMSIALPLSGIFALWLGIMRLAELSGLVALVARALRPITRRLFPDVPPDHPALGAMAMNIAANMLGLGNAATPLGLRAMRGLEQLNPRPGTASNAMCTFLAINTSSVQLIPTTAVAILAINGARNPWAIIGSAFMATCCACAAGITSVRLLEKLPAYRLAPLPAGAQTSLPAAGGAEADAAVSAEAARPSLTGRGRWMLAAYGLAMALLFFSIAFPAQATAAVAALHRVFSVSFLEFHFAPLNPGLARQGLATRLINALSIIALPGMLTFFPLYAWLRGVKVYEEFVEGAKEGFQVAIRVIPFLVAILVAVKMFREAGGIALIAQLLGPVLQRVGFPVDLLPLVLVRPLSGGATTGIFTDIVKTFGPDHINSLMAGTIFGSTETTFYVIAVYFGAVGIRRTRHAVPAGLIADTVGVIASVVICRLMFG
jgi:spore maturation protein SpmA